MAIRPLVELDLPDAPVGPPTTFLHKECPIDTQVEVTTVTLKGSGGNTGRIVKPVYNLAPSPGAVAKLGFAIGIFFYEGDVSVRPLDRPGEPDAYGLKTTFYDATAGPIEIDNVSLTVWGVPADSIHDPLRWKPSGKSASEGSFDHPSEMTPVAYLTNPTSCEGEGTQLNAVFRVTSWEHPDEDEDPAPTDMAFGPIVGCDSLTIEPSLTAEVSTNKASSPTGFDLGTSIPQTYSNAEGLATSALKKEVVTLPEGTTVNPSAGSGLGACTPAEYEEGAQIVPGRGCPNDSKIGSVRVTTPSLKEEAVGSVFLAQPAPFGEPGQNPFNSLLAVYLVARIADRGVLIESPGLVQANEITGQLTTTFDNLPPLPFSLATFSFNQGATSPLVTPPLCGAYTVQADLSPLSDPTEVLSPEVPPFAISSGFDGGACPSGVASFTPHVIAGTENNAAASYSPFILRVIRNDGEQEITGFASLFPPGLSGNLTGIPFCSEAAIAAARAKTGIQEEVEPSCPQASQIGHLVAEAGVGTVLAYAQGKIYMAGPYNGAPFSIVGIVSAKVGPFDLGTVVVHLPLQIDPETAAVSVGAGGSDQIPHIIDGIVVHVRDIRVYIDRPSFSLNPTNCQPETFATTIDGSGANFVSSTDDVPVTVNADFQAVNCQALHFAPTFKVSTSARASRANGADLSVKLTYPNAPVGTQANIRSVKVDLPTQLPSRLTTLQKACTAATFEANPALCPSASRVGNATAITPILPVPLVGPAYFVSHGGAKFPELIVVLQGYGVTIDLHGETFISKAGITSSTFRSVPDQPVTSFELTLPAGPYSALAANLPPSAKGSFCGEKLTMPTAFAAQNGAEIHQSTPITVTGCAKHKAKTKTKKKKGRGKAGKTSPKRK